MPRANDDGGMNAFTSPAEPPSRVVAGYRVVRRLADGPRAEVFLATGDGATVVLKVYRAEAGRESIDIELEALSRGALEHRVRLLDVGTGDDELPVAVLERVPGGSLGQLLARRSGLEPGEAVTIVAPIARLAGELHRSGIAHRGIGVDTVHFGESGQPVLLGFGGSVVFPQGQPPAGLDLQPGVIADRERLAGLASLVIESVREGARTATLERIGDWLSARTAPVGAEFPRELEERLFDAADAVPVGLATASTGNGTRTGVSAASHRGGPVAVPPRTSPAVRGGLPRESRRHGSTAVHRSARSAIATPDRVALVANVLGAAPLAATRTRALSSLRAVRRPVWWAAVAVVAALAAALVLVPAGDGSPEPAVPSTVEATVSSPAPQTGGPADASATSPRDAADPESAAVTGNDPAAALGPLLTARKRCFDELSALCLASVDQAGSAALAGDTALIAGTTPAGWVPAPNTTARRATAVDREGDSAIVRFGAHSKPASVLMIRNEAGWRIRSFAEP